MDILKDTIDRLKFLYKSQGLLAGSISKIAIKPQWNVIFGSNGQCGHALNFTGIHDLYEKDGEGIPGLKALIGVDLFTVAEANLKSDDIIKRSISAACINALSQPLLNPDLAGKRDVKIHHWHDFHWDKSRGISLRHFIRPDDIAVIVGYGGMASRIARLSRELHVTELRPKKTFQSLIISDDIAYGPEKIQIHPAEENEAVLKKADFIMITASSLVNNTFNELLSYSKNARYVGLYGPGASMIPDVLFEKGLHFTVSWRLIDQKKYEEAMVDALDMEASLKETQEGYIASAPDIIV
jgi:uncharacterized protein (DUF4213/DUF364 family)